MDINDSSDYINSSFTRLLPSEETDTFYLSLRRCDR